MSDNWDVEQIRRLVRESGRPMEIRCGNLFAEKQWTVSHGSYFHDVTTGNVREVDLIAGRLQRVGPENEEGLESKWCSMGVFISCKGFREDQVPIMYSVGGSFPTILKPRLKYDYTRITDKDLFEGVDSALKAAIFWQTISSSSDVYLRVPVLVTSKPWFDVPLDKGEVGMPVQSTRGYKTTLYPYKGVAEPELLTSLIWAEEELPVLVDALNKLFSWFVDEVDSQLREHEEGGDER